jgi:hypothetical protein
VEGIEATFDITREIVPEAGSFQISGTNADLEASRTFDAAAGSFAVTGTGATLNLFGSLQVTAVAGEFSISGQAATLVATEPPAPPEEITSNAPSYAYWRKTKQKNKPKAPELPPPMKAEVTIDPAVLEQIAAEERARESQRKRQEALARIYEARDRYPPRRRVLR